MEASSSSATLYKCGSCQALLCGPIRFLIHSRTHLTQGPQLFHTKGLALKIEELPNKFNIFIPRIELQPFEDTCRKAKLNLSQIKIPLERLSELQIQAAVEESKKRKLRERTNRPKYNILAGEDEDDDNCDHEPSVQIEEDIEFIPTKPKRQRNRNKVPVADTATAIATQSRSRASQNKRIVDGYPCPYCPKKYDSKPILERHVILHEERNRKNATKPFLCTMCPLGFTQKIHLKRHFLLHMENNPYKCDFPGCNHRSTTGDNLLLHIRHHFATNQCCPICDREYASARGVRDHMARSHPNGETVQLRRQLKTTGVRHRLQRADRNVMIPEHLSRAAQEIPRNLAHAEVFQVSQEDVNRVEVDSVHLGDAAGIKEESALALAEVKEELELMDHAEEDEVTTEERDETSNIIDPESPPQDSPVGARYIKSQPAVDIYKSDPVIQRLAKVNPQFVKLLTVGDGNGTYTTGGDPGAFPCKICVFPKISYPRIRFLKEHMLKHHPEAVEPEAGPELLLACDRCGFQCETTQKLARHRKTHGNIKSFRCPECGVNFEKQARMELHLQNVHRTEKNFKCDRPKCTKSYATKAYLKIHIRRIHMVSDEDPAECVCKVCGKQTRSLISLKAHMALHDKNRKFHYCKICNEKLSNAASLKRHIRLIHVNPGPSLLPVAQRQVVKTENEANIFL